MQAKNHQVQLTLPQIPAGTYLVAVSGGVDSVVLLDMLAGRPGLELHVAHVDHGIRPDSHRDLDFVHDLAAGYGLPFYSAALSLGHAASEDTARRSRYSALTRLAAQAGASAIITAHHLDDRQETSVFNLLRGTGRHGAAPLHTTARVLRPLLRARKSGLVSYARERGLRWREDPTNRQLHYDRNFIRREFMPTARHGGTDFDQAYASALSRLDRLNLRLDQALDSLIDTSRPGAASVSRADVSSFSLPALTELYSRMVQHAAPGTEVSAKTLYALAVLTKRGSAGAQKTIAASLSAHIRYDTVTIAIDTPGQAIPSPLDLRPGANIYGPHRIILADSPGPGTPRSQVALKPAALTVRAARPGDRIAPTGLGGTKKLQDLFTDSRIDRYNRPYWPVIVDNLDQVVWVPGLAVSRRHTARPGEAQAYYLTHEVI